MNIIEAMKLVQQGKKVRRTAWPVGDFVVRCETSPTQMLYSYINPFIDNYRECDRWAARLDSLLAEDWEVVDD